MTIKDISKLTGYSVGTVSRVLNNQPNVSEKARKAILDVANAAGFQLNENAKRLKQQRATTVLAIVKGTSNELFGTLLEALQAQMALWPCPLMVDYIDEEDNEVQRGIRLCREKKPMGIFFLGGNAQYFREAFHLIDVPCVLITGDASELNFPNLSSVTTDDIAAGYLAVNHLIRAGHKDIGIIGGWRGTTGITELRLQGCTKAFLENGLPFDPGKDFYSGRFSFSGGYQAATALLRSGKPITAIYSMADVMAVGAIRALKDWGLCVPEEVSVIGTDGLEFGEYTVPKLVSVRQSPEELAIRSVQLLRSHLEDHRQACHDTIAPLLIRSESVRTAK